MQADSNALSMLPAERRSMAVIALVAICRIFGLFALLPVISVFVAELDGATPLLIGIAVGGYGLTQAALQLPFGALSDRIGRLPVIVFGLLIFAAGSALAATSDTIYGVIAGRLLQGAGAISATLTALLADRTREAIRTRAMAFLGIGIGSAFLLALIIGPVIAAAGGVRAVFWTAAGLPIAAAFLLLLLPFDVSDKKVQASANKHGSIAGALRADLLRLDLYIFLLHAVLTASFVALPFLLRNSLDMPLTEHWKIYVAALVLSLVGTVPLILADERRGKALILGVAILLVACGQMALAVLAPGTVVAVASLAIFFAGFNFLEAALPARVSVQAPLAVRGASLGVYSSAQFLGAFAGGLLGGWLLATGKPHWVFMSLGLLSFVWLAAHRIWER